MRREGKRGLGEGSGVPPNVYSPQPHTKATDYTKLPIFFRFHRVESERVSGESIPSMLCQQY